MSNVIKPKRGSTDPAPGVLAEGEIGINTSAATAFIGVAEGGNKKLNAARSEETDSVDTSGEATANGNRHIWFSDLDNEKVRAYNGNFQYNPATNAISSNVSGTSSNVTGTVSIAHGGTGATTRDLALTALFAGGSGSADANIVASGTYVLTTETASNLPPKPGYYLLSVFRYDIYDLACGQIAIHLSDGTLYSRDYVGGNWKEWVCCSSKQIDSISIPSGADLNDYKNKGFYASHLVGNSITNLPSGYDSGAFELTVTGIGEDGVYCTQWLKSFNSNKLWVRTQLNWKEPWSWTDWEQIPVKNEVLTRDSEGIELGTKVTVGHGGYIDFHFHGSEEDYTSRIIESRKGRLSAISDLDVSGWLQCSNGFWIAGGGLYASNNNYMVYGTALPSAGTKGRIFFKKA